MLVLNFACSCKVAGLLHGLTGFSAVLWALGRFCGLLHGFAGFHTVPQAFAQFCVLLGSFVPFCMLLRGFVHFCMLSHGLEVLYEGGLEYLQVASHTCRWHSTLAGGIAP